MDLPSVRPDATPVLLVEQPVTPREAAERRQLVKAVKAVNESNLFGYAAELTYAVDRASKKTVVRIVDRETRELIQQIPSEEVLRLASLLGDRAS